MDLTPRIKYGGRFFGRLRRAEQQSTILSNLVLPISTTLRQIRKSPLAGALAYLAEREGFEPSKGYKPLPDFESGTFDHSATSPVAPAV